MAAAKGGEAGGRKGLEILVAGGGIGGLALARALQLRGIAVTVLERDTSIAARPQGYSLTIQGGIQALDALGLGDTVRASAGGVERSGQHILSPRGSVVLALGGTNKKRRGNGSGKGRNVYIPRQRLRCILADSLKEGTICWGSAAQGFKEEVEAGRKKLCVSLTDGSTIMCDVLVAADGVHSKIRASTLPDPLRFMGVISICGINQSDHPLFLGGSVQVLDGRTRLFIKPFDGTSDSSCSGSSNTSEDGTEQKIPPAQTGASASPASETQTASEVMWQLTAPMSEAQVSSMASSPDQLFDFAKSAVSNWGTHLQQLLLSTPLHRWRGGPLLDRDPELCAPSRGCRVAFLGDSAHPMSPFKGQGANQALLDSIELAEAVASVANSSDCETAMDQALETYHARMRERVRPFVDGSRRNVEFFHTEAALPGSESMLHFFGVRDQATISQQAQRAKTINAELVAGGFASPRE